MTNLQNDRNTMNDREGSSGSNRRPGDTIMTKKLTFKLYLPKQNNNVGLHAH